jgi:catalase
VPSCLPWTATAQSEAKRAELTEESYVGVIEITSVAVDSNAEQRALVFMPTALPAGIETADPMIAARSSAYPVSYSRRHQ